MVTGIRLMVLLAAGATGLLVLAACLFAAGASGNRPLPPPALKGIKSLEETLAARRSVRRFGAEALSAEQISQLCWAAQGITDKARGYRTCPSAGATYPLELYVVTADGVDHYRPAGHALERHRDGDLRRALQEASLHQTFVGQAPATFVITAVVPQTERKYGERAIRYVHMEAGHCGQNILLQAVALGLGAVPVGAFGDEAVAKVLSLPPEHAPLYLIPVGHPEGTR
jgi:SagB-type dehydrogenase family enzyme